MSFNKRFFPFFLATTISLSCDLKANDTILPEFFPNDAVSTAYVGPLDKANSIVDKGAEALHYIGRDTVIDSLNYVSDSANNLVEKGVTLHFGSHKIIPQIGFCTVGILASACGLGVITHTALKKNQNNTKPKYWASFGMITLGMASLFTSYLLSARA